MGCNALYSGRSLAPEDGEDIKKDKLRELGPLANYTDRATASCRRSYANLCGQRVPHG
jgi:hypothetical protein